MLWAVGFLIYIQLLIVDGFFSCLFNNLRIMLLGFKYKLK